MEAFSTTRIHKYGHCHGCVTLFSTCCLHSSSTDGFSSMIDALSSPLFPLEEISPETFVKLPKTPNAESRSVKLYIILAEPHIYLEGFTKAEVTSRPPAIIRGCLFLRVLHHVKIKEINLKLKGVCRTEWPEGIPPKKTEYFEQSGVISHTWPFFNHQHTYPVSPNVRNNADLFIPKNDSDVSNFSLDGSLSPVTSHGDLKPIMSPTSFLKSFKAPSGMTNKQHDLTTTLSNAGNSDENKIFIPGDYIYSFELPIQSSLPETVNVTFGSISYALEAHVERSGAFKSNLTAKRPLTIIRAPSENSSEENEPIIIDRDWEKRLQYDIIIHSKQVVLNSYLPISFRMIPLEKIKIQRLRVYMTEHLDYYCHNKKVHRTEPPKKIMLLEHKPPKPLDNLLAIGDDEIGGVELDFQVFVPEYYNERFHLHPDTTSENIQSHHWIKICIRISMAEPTTEDPDKRKHYELSIDSPIHLLNPNCVHANTLLPSYEEQLKMDSILMGENVSSKTLTPVGTPQVVSLQRQPIDKMMSPKEGTILDSNLYKPKDTVPIELLSPQAKPFSTVASPELNAMNPELRDTPLFLLSPVVSPMSLAGGERSRSTSRPPVIRSSTLSHLPKVGSKLNLLPRMPSTSSLNEPPPPPFVEHPPSYDEVVKDNKMRGRQQTTSSTASTESANSSKSEKSSNSDNSSSRLQIQVPRPSITQRTASTTSVSSISGSTSASSLTQQQQKTTRISLKLGGISNNPTSRRVPALTTPAASNTDQPSISAFLDSALAHAENMEHKPSSYSNMISLRSESRGRTKNKDIDSVDLAHDTNLKFKITPIRSSSNSPYISPVNSRSTSPIRSLSPVPIVANDRNMNKLINTRFTPAFTINETRDLSGDIPIIASPVLHPVVSKGSSISSDPDETIERPLLVVPERISMDSANFTFQQPNMTMNSLASLDLISSNIRGASISEPSARGLDLNYMGNILDSIDDGTDITNMLS